MSEELRQLDALVAEKLMEWERVMLFDQTLNWEWSTPGAKMYTTGAQVPYLVPPGKMGEGDKCVLARERVGDLTIGGAEDLPARG